MWPAFRSRDLVWMLVRESLVGVAMAVVAVALILGWWLFLGGI